MKSILFLLVVVVAIATAIAYPPQPPRERRGVPPEIDKPFDQIVPSLTPYTFPRAGRALDDGWSFRDTLLDANPNNPELFNAYPVGLALTHQGRGYVATLHTVFGTQDYGRTWQNLDQNPPPGGSAFQVFRSPNFISALAPRTVRRDSARYDTFYVVTQNALYDSSAVRFLRYIVNSWYLPTVDVPIVRDNMWLTHMAVPDSHTAALLSGGAGRILRTDTLTRNSAWHELDYNFFGGYLAGRLDVIDSTIIAVGSNYWKSRDQGRTWEVAPPIDPLGDYGVDFCDEQHGWVGGGRLSPTPTGWVRRTTDGGASWSARLHNTPYPIRSVACVNDTLAWIAGGNYDEAVGGIWKTTDGGATWTEELSVPAEIRTLEHTRVSPAYIDLVAAGVFPDLQGGIWTQRIFAPDTTGRGPVMFLRPDTLIFGPTFIAERETLSTWLYNIGEFAPQLLGFAVRGAPFNAAVQHIGDILAPGDSLEIKIVFTPSAPGEYFAPGIQENNYNQLVEVQCFGSAVLDADPLNPALPAAPTLNVSPNPGNSEFRLEFDIKQPAFIRLSIFDLQGRIVTELVHESLSTGQHITTWSAANLPSGLYFARLNSTDFSVTRKILLLK